MSLRCPACVRAASNKAIVWMIVGGFLGCGNHVLMVAASVVGNVNCTRVSGLPSSSNYAPSLAMENGIAVWFVAVIGWGLVGVRLTVGKGASAVLASDIVEAG